MFDEFFRRANELRAAGVPFATAVVVRAERPTSAKPGDSAIVTLDGTMFGWIGGSCAQPTVVKEAVRALADGTPRLIRLSPDPGSGDLPEGISEAAPKIDAQLMLTMIVTGVAFFAAQGLLGFVIWKYRARGEERADYIHGNNLVEVGGMVITAVAFIALGITGQKVWASVHMSGPTPGALQIEVTGEQFLWNVRYPGPDGEFGRTAIEYIERVGNTVGVVPDDPAGADDLIVINNIAIPVNTPIEITLRSKDVLHDLYLPNVRLKQDAVPGMAIPLRFKTTKTGDYELACAELCGLGHYQMRGFLRVMEPAAYQDWLQEMAEE